MIVKKLVMAALSFSLTLPMFSQFLPLKTSAAATDVESQLVPLREYIDLRFSETQRAIDKAESSMNERLASMNEFRATLKDQSAKFITREEVTSMLERIQENVTALQKLSDISTGKASQTSMIIALVISLASLGLGLAKTKAANQC